MNKLSSSFFLTVSLFFLWSCTSHTQTSHLDAAPVVARKVDLNGEALIVSDYAVFGEKINIPLSSLLSSFEAIILDNSEEALVAADGMVTVSENYIAISSYSARAFKLFDKQGKYLCTITRVGDGPDDYFLGLYDSFIDEEKQLIYILPYRAQKIMVFNLQGNPQKHIPLAYITHKGRMIIDPDNRKITILALPFDDTPSVAWIQDFDGNILQEIPTGHFEINPGDYSNELGFPFNSGHIDFSTFYCVKRADSLYHYLPEINKLQPVFTMNFESDDVLNQYSELPDHYFVTLYPIWGAEELKYSKILIDKQTLRGAFVELKMDMLGNTDPHKFHYFSRGYFISLIDADELSEKLSEALTKPQKLSPEVIENITELQKRLVNEDDLVLLTGKLK